MSKGFTDWTDLGIFPLQDVEENVPIGIRMALVGGRVFKRPEAGDNGAASLTEYAREDGLGTLGDIHPWLFWQTKEREKRAMGSWSMGWGGIVTDSASTRYAGVAGVQPLTRNENDQVNDIRYRVIQPAWQDVLPWQPEGMLAMVMPSTDEVNPSSVMLNGDRRLVAAGAGGPGQAGTTIVDLQPSGVLCMGGSSTPGQGGRHARLQGLVRVIALTPSSGGPLGGPDLNSLAINYGVSQQEGILGYGMIFGPSVSGGGSSGGGAGPTTGQTGPVRPGGPGASGAGPGPGGPPPPGNPGDGGFAGPGGGSFNSGSPEGPNASKETSVADFGTFQAKARPGYAIGFMSAAASGPITFGCIKHGIGVDKDGHRMTSAHISTDAYFYNSSDRDGPLMFEGRFPDNVGEHPIPSLVHLSWDERFRHRFIGGERMGKWRWYTTVPYVEAKDEDEDEDGKTKPPTGSGPSTPSTPSAPTGPTTGGGGGGPSNPNAPGTPGAPTAPNAPNAPSSPATPGSGPSTPTGPGTGDGNGEDHPVGPVRPAGPVEPPDPPWESPLKPTGPVRPGGGPAVPPTPRYLLEGNNQRPLSLIPVAPGGSVFAGRGTKYNNLDLEPIADTVKENGGPAGVVNQVGGSERGRDVGLYAIFHPFNTGFAAITFRPQLWIKGLPNFEHNPLLGARAYKTEERTRPSVLTIRAWGAQSQSGDWDYAELPVSSRARGGLVNGGLLIAPSEFEMEDYLGINSTADTDNPTAATYVTFAPTVAITFGKPTTVGSPTVGSMLVHQETAAGKLLISEITDAAGSTTNILKASLLSGEGYLELEGTGAVKIPSGTTAQRPGLLLAGLFRFNTTTGVPEVNNGTAYVKLFPFTGGTITGAVVISSGNLTLADNVALRLGNAADATLTYDGSNLFLNPKAVGSGKLFLQSDLRFIDNDGVQFGTGTDAEIVYDGTDLIVTPDLVGSGAFRVAGDFEVASTARIETDLAVGKTGDPVASAVLEAESTTRGFLPPRMTTTQRDAISSPATGLTIYNTTTDTVDVFTGSAWESLTFSA